MLLKVEYFQIENKKGLTSILDSVNHVARVAKLSTVSSSKYQLLNEYFKDY